MPKVSQKDIANKLNISRVTVTKALQDHPDIALKTRETIKNMAYQLGYFPDFIGRSLVKGQTFTIGIILPKIAHSFFALAVEKFYEFANEKGYNIIPMISFEDPAKEKKNIETLLSMRVDGVIIDTSGHEGQDDIYGLIRKSGTKFLFFDRAPVNSDESAVLLNDREASYNMTKMLLNKGYKRICHFAGSDGISITVDRQKGYEDAMAEAGFESQIWKTNMLPKSGYEKFKELSNENQLPEAIFAINDSVAQGIYQAINELGLRIPEDIAVAGFGDIDISKLLNPPLTTVHIPMEDMTKFAIHKLIEMIQNDTYIKRKTIFNGELVIREST